MTSVDARADYLGGGAGHPAPALGGLVSVERGGVAYWTAEAGWTGPSIAPPALEAVERADPGGGDGPGSEALVFRGAVAGRPASYAFLLAVADVPGLLEDLARERRAAGLPPVPAPEFEPEPDHAPSSGACALPDAAEGDALPPDSLPYAWLRITADVPRNRCRHVDGMALLLELAVRGHADAGPGRELRIGPPATGNPALDGALRRLASPGRPAAPEVAGWLGRYAGALSVDAAGADAQQARVAAAIFSGEPRDLRDQLLGWLVAQDDVLGQVALAALVGGRPASARRAVRRLPHPASQSDPEGGARAHRVLSQLLVQPPRAAV